MIKLYGQSHSRASRSLWMLEEIGIPYQHLPVRPYTESRSPDYLRINPNGHIPCLDDDGFILWESLAINLYLAERYAVAPLWPAAVKDHARAYQWSFWAANEIEPRIVRIARSLREKSSEQSGLVALLQELSAAFRVLEDALGGSAHLLGDAFSVADLNVASTMREPWEGGVSGIGAIDLAPFPGIARWLDRCGERAANRRVAELP